MQLIHRDLECQCATKYAILSEYQAIEKHLNQLMLLFTLTVKMINDIRIQHIV